MAFEKWVNQYIKDTGRTEQDLIDEAEFEDIEEAYKAGKKELARKALHKYFNDKADDEIGGDQPCCEYDTEGEKGYCAEHKLIRLLEREVETK